MMKLISDLISIFSSKPNGFSEEINIYSPADGEVILLNEVKDPVFSDGSMGNGCAIIPTKGELYSPISGEITTIFPTNHAIGIIGNNREELLLHIGVNTVELNGTGFTPFVEKGDHVGVDTLLMKFDLNFIKERRYDPDIMIILLNSNQYKGISFEPGSIKHGEVKWTPSSRH